MINYLDNLLRHLFMTDIAELTDEPQIRFQPPDEDWRNYVSGLEGNALNIYLADLRENRKLRSNERVHENQNSIINQTPAPRRIDCHYLITGWSPAQPGPSVEPTPDEHALLYQVTHVLMNHDPLIPREIYAPDPLPPSFPEIIGDAELPTSILPVEGFLKLPEFWGTMGVNHRWKPAVYLVITLPVVLPTEVAGPMVTTRITEYRQTGQAETAEVWMQIGGQVLDATNVPPDDAPTPIENAWVQLETMGGQRLQTTRTNELGRFTFGELQAGQYRLRFSATGFSEAVREIGVPSPTGEYDLRFE